MRKAPLIILCLLTPSTLGGMTHGPEHVLVVANRNSRDSLAVAHHYTARRGIPPENVVHLDCPDMETISRDTFDRRVHWPLLRHLARSGVGARIRFIVTTRGVPLRVEGSPGPEGYRFKASVDSELCLLRWELANPRHLPPLENAVRNPYFRADPDFTGESPFDPRRWPIYLVTRLTGFTLEDVRALIARADHPRAPGLFAVDLRQRPNMVGGDAFLVGAAHQLTLLGQRVLLEETREPLDGVGGLSGYASWGSNDPSRSSRHLSLGFLPGAIACTLVSTNARTFIAPPPSWDLVGWEQRDQFYAGSPQTLAGDLVHQGVTGAWGNVWEPGLGGTARPDIALPAYAAGYTLAEAYYQATPVISWQGVVVGDPLCRLPVEGGSR